MFSGTSEQVIIRMGNYDYKKEVLNDDSEAYNYIFREGRNNSITKNLLAMQPIEFEDFNFGFVKTNATADEADDWLVNRIWIQDGETTYFYNCNCWVKRENDYWATAQFEYSYEEKVSLSQFIMTLD